ncbi:MAG TPA: leucine zipper domain-containing protein, partial [Candidatus Sulfomarinibacteraceae bacterium]|nr:leucine zipper domain-containing protein [Candidatus Sulfomarinibacteraceae bacterium]
GERVSVLSSEYGVSRQTIYKWLRRFESGGACELFDRSRKPHRSPNRIREELFGVPVTYLYNCALSPRCLMRRNNYTNMYPAPKGRVVVSDAVRVTASRPTNS